MHVSWFLAYVFPNLRIESFVRPNPVTNFTWQQEENVSISVSGFSGGQTECLWPSVKELGVHKPDYYSSHMQKIWYICEYE